jgi:hypothetical protein
MTQESNQDHHQRVTQRQQPQLPQDQKQLHQDESEKQYQKRSSITKHVIPIMVVGAQQPPSQRHSKLNEKTYLQCLDLEKNKRLVVETEDSCSALTHHQPIIRQRQTTFQPINQPQLAEKKFNYQSFHRRPHHQHMPITKEIQRQECNDRTTNSVRLNFNARNIDIPLKAVLRIKCRNSSLIEKLRPNNITKDQISSKYSSRKSAIYGNSYRYYCTSTNKFDLNKFNKSYRTNFHKLSPDCKLCLAFLRYLNEEDKNDFRDICKQHNIEICD